MAGDWIKMRTDLAEDPAVIGIAAALDLDEDTVVGKLHRLWSWADRQSRDGHAVGVTEKWIDRYARCDGFASAMVSVGWLAFGASGLTLPNFDRHNGKTAKTRALSSNRQQIRRAVVAPPVTTPSRTQRDECVTREEKRREEIAVPYGTGADAPATREPSEQPTDRDMVFALGVPLLTAAGVSEKNARSMLAQLSKAHGDTAVYAAVLTTSQNGAGEPVSYLQRLLGKGRASRLNPQEALEASNREVARRWAEGNIHAAA